MTTIRTDLELDEISLVDKGANPGAKVALFKRLEKAASFQDILDGMDAQMKAHEVQARLYELNDVFQRAMQGIMEDEEETDKAAAIQRSIDEFKEAMRVGLEKAARAARGETMPDDVKLKEQLDKLQEQVTDLTKRAEEAEAKVQKAEADVKAARGEVDELRKKYEPAPEAKLPESVQKQWDADREELRKIREERDQDRLLKVAGELSKLPAKAEEVAEVLKSVPEGEKRDALVALLKAAQEGINVTRELGGEGDSNADGATAQIEKLAQELVSKGEARDIYTARTQVRKANPALKAQEAAERQARH